jgi:hypothetical protein
MALARKVQTSRDIFRVSGVTRRDPEIEAWFDECPDDLGAIARTWFALMRACGPDVREAIHDGCPVACIADAPFGYVDVFTAHANVGFFQGASLPDPKRLLQGTGKFMRHVKLKPGVAVDAPSLDALIRAAYLDMRKRLATAAS